jgi:hypothetical protein
MKRETIQFHDSNQARVLHAAPPTPARRIIELLNLPWPRAVVILNGGTLEMEGPLRARIGELMQDGLARVAAEEEITLVTGGTDAGIFALLGQGLAKWGRTAPCIGVAVAELVKCAAHSDGEVPLESHHSHFVLVKGKRWGDETKAMYDLAETLSRKCPSLAIFVGGGEITKREMEINVRQGREMVLISGSGRTTDAVLHTRSYESMEDHRLAEIAQKGRITLFNLGNQPSALGDLIRELLFKQRGDKK